jgi:hypothetical protein
LTEKEGADFLLLPAFRVTYKKCYFADLQCHLVKIKGSLLTLFSGKRVILNGMQWNEESLS